MIYLVLTLLCFLVYWPSLPGPLRLHDDQGSIIARKSEFESHLPVRWWLHKLLTSPSRPVYNLVNYLQFRLCGFWAPSWHVVNYALHVVTTCLLLHTLNRLGWESAMWLSVAFAVHIASCLVRLKFVKKSCHSFFFVKRVRSLGPD